MNILIQFKGQSLSFAHPHALIICRRPADLMSAFEKMEYWLSKGSYVAGFVSYEAGYCLERCLASKENYDFPLMCMGVYSAPEPSRLLIHKKDFTLRNARLSCSFRDYAQHIQRIREYIQKGDVYQITYCLKLFCDISGSVNSLYGHLLQEHPVPYAAYIEHDPWKILSFSPERFIKKKGSRILTEPMKGTWPRGNNILSDVLARFHLKYDIKNRAENVMIADLLRNDLGRIASHIRAPKLFTVAGYNTLFQMTSTVTGRVNPQKTMRDIFSALFPSGSVTGAPKIRAMQIIQELEPFERKIYTGAIGYITPKKDCYFNIPIRTILIENSKAEMGIGGGIVWDSTAEGEWNEGMLKARFLMKHVRKDL